MTKPITALLRTVLRLFYRVRIEGLDNFPHDSQRLLIVANHTSFLDALLLGLFLPCQPVFAINTHIARRWWMRPIGRLVKTFALDPTNPLALKSLVKQVKSGQPVVIFPEGRITVTGSLMKIYDGPGLVADRAQADVVPVRIDGAQYTPFSRLRGRVRLRWFPAITLSILPARRIDPPAEVRGRARRRQAGERLTQLMTEMVFTTSHIDRTLSGALRDGLRIHGRKHLVVDDIQRSPMSYGALLRAVCAFAPRLSAGTYPGERVGLLLPNSRAAVIALLGLSSQGRVPAMLNFSVGAGALQDACRTARLRQVITSRRFIEQARLEPLLGQLSQEITVRYLEDEAAALTPGEKLRGWLQARLGAPGLGRGQQADDAAVVLFTSGSEGSPKGVVLSHRNLLANHAQMAARVDFTAQDVILNALPMFHSFGLTAGTLLPILNGMRCVLYPSPLHYRIVPEMAYDVNATILFGTNTFLSGYARFAHAYDFYSVRYIFAGAEKLAEATRRLYAEQYGVRIFEGYGATETAPVLAVNTPMANRPGSVGRLLPAIEHRLEPVPGVAEGGRLHVRGPNIMKGYLLAEEPGRLVPPASTCGDGWYDTGDIVTVDDEGFVRISGRAKRFAKVGGEMVSLSAAESLAAGLWPDHAHAVIALPDPRKGEQLVLVTEHPEADRAALQAWARDQGAGELAVPRTILHTRTLPVLGTGKLDYPAITRLAEQHNGGAS